MQVRRWLVVAAVVAAAVVEAPASTSPAAAVEPSVAGDYIVHTQLAPQAAETLVAGTGADVIASYPLGGTFVIVSAGADEARGQRNGPRGRMPPPELGPPKRP